MPEGEDGSRARRALASPQRRAPARPSPFARCSRGGAGALSLRGDERERRPPFCSTTRCTSCRLSAPEASPGATLTARAGRRTAPPGRRRRGRARPAPRPGIPCARSARLGCGSAAALAPWLSTASTSPCAIPPSSAARPPPARCSACSTSGGPRPSTGEPGGGAARGRPGASCGGARGRAGRSGARRPGPWLFQPRGSLPPPLGPCPGEEAVPAAPARGAAARPGSAARVVCAFSFFQSASSR